MFSRRTTSLFKDFQLQLAEDQNKLRPFISEPFNLEAFEGQIKRKALSYSVESRALLVKRIQVQYGSNQSVIQDQLNLLAKPNTFTVTTGHQLSLFTGPLFFVIKILQVIKLADELKRAYPQFNFLPVFWMASEDHDFDEIKSVELFNQKLEWTTNQNGAVGRFNTDRLVELKTTFSSFFDRFPESEIHSLLKSYQGATLAEATRNFVLALFADYKLLIVDGDDVELKRSFIPSMMKEIETSFSFHAVSSTNKGLDEKSIPLQVTPREINLFYLKDGRHRIIKEGTDTFKLGSEGAILSSKAMLEELESHPDKFSPNVVLRPLYQETVLPNLCYTGGLGELTYWLQLKCVFDAMEIPYPLIQVRNSLIWIDRSTHKKMHKLQLQNEDIFKSADVLIRELVDEKGVTLDFEDIAAKRIQLEASVLNLAGKDPSMEDMLKSELRRIEKLIQGIEQKMIKIEKAKYETEIAQIKNVKEKLFPNGDWQERKINFFQLCANGEYRKVLETIYTALEPLSSDIALMIESE